MPFRFWCEEGGGRAALKTNVGQNTKTKYKKKKSKLKCGKNPRAFLLMMVEEGTFLQARLL